MNALVDGLVRMRDRNGPPKTAFVIVTRHSKSQGGLCVLLQRRGRVGKGKLLLGLPGGMIDAGESPVVAASRELQEETQIYVHPNNLSFLGYSEGAAIYATSVTHHYIKGPEPSSMHEIDTGWGFNGHYWCLLSPDGKLKASYNDQHGNSAYVWSYTRKAVELDAKSRAPYFPPGVFPQARRLRRNGMVIRLEDSSTLRLLITPRPVLY